MTVLRPYLPWILSLLLAAASPSSAPASGKEPAPASAHEEAKDNPGAPSRGDHASSDHAAVPGAEPGTPEYILSVLPDAGLSTPERPVFVLKLEVIYKDLGEQAMAEALLWWTTPSGSRRTITMAPVDNGFWAAKVEPGPEPGAHRLRVIILHDAHARGEEGGLEDLLELSYVLDTPQRLLTRESTRKLVEMPAAAPHGSGEGHDAAVALEDGSGKRHGAGGLNWTLVALLAFFTFLIMGGFAMGAWMLRAKLRHFLSLRKKQAAAEGEEAEVDAASDPLAEATMAGGTRLDVNGSLAPIADASMNLEITQLDAGSGGDAVEQVAIDSTTDVLLNQLQQSMDELTRSTPATETADPGMPAAEMFAGEVGGFSDDSDPDELPSPLGTPVGDESELAGAGAKKSEPVLPEPRRETPASEGQLNLDDLSF